MAQLICNICHLAFNSMSEYDKHVLVHTESPRDPPLIEREKTHGSFVRTAGIAQSLKEIVHYENAKDLPKVQIEALDMICTKIARILSGDHKCKDHFEDIAGYAKLGSEACDG